MKARLLGTLLTLCTIGLACCSGGSLKQDVARPIQSLELVGRARISAVYDIEVVPPYAYALERGILRVLNIQYPTAVREVGSLEFERPRSRMALRFPYLYLTGFGQPMGVIDISNPIQPRWVAEVPELSGIMSDGFEMAGDTGYVVRVAESDLQTILTGKAGSLLFEVFDLEIPARPRRLASLDLGIRISGVEYGGIAHSDGRAFVLVRRAADDAPRSRIIIVDSRVPTKPRIERTLFLPEGKLYRDVEVRRDLLFLLQRRPQQGLTIYRLNEENEPEFLGGLIDPRFQLPVDLIVYGDVVYATFKGEIDLATFDVSNPREPKLIHTHTIEDLWAAGIGMTLVENRLYVAGDGGPAPIFDVSDPIAPRLLGRWTFEGGFVGDVLREGKLAILTNIGGGVIIYDITNPTAPKRLARYQAGSSNTPQDWQWSVVAAVHGSRVFVAYETLPAEVMDISNPTHPVALGRFTPRGLVHAIVLTPTHAFLGYGTPAEGKTPRLYDPASVTGQGGIEVVDLTSPQNPRAVAALELNQAVTDLALGSDWLVAAHNDGSLTTVDIRDPAQPSVSGSFVGSGPVTTGFPLRGTHLALSPDGNRAYLVSRNTPTNGDPYVGQDTLAVIDLKDVKMPRVLGQLIVDRHRVGESSMALLGGHVIIFAGDILIVDVNDPTRPTVKVRQPFPPVQYWTPESVGLALDKKYLYLSAGEDGFWIYRLPAPLRK